MAGAAGAAPEACAPCHEKQYAAQRGTHHAQALRRIAGSPLPGLYIGAPLRERSGYTFEYGAAREGLRVAITRGAERFEAPLEWVFGAGSKAFTPVGRIDGEYFEHRVSWYRESGRLGLTPGHNPSPAPDARTAAGIPQSAETITRCFNCHASGVRPGPDLSAITPGVTCERCHGPGGEHLASGKAAILNPGKLPASAQVQICGECHRSPNAQFQSRMPELEDPVSIRFAPVGFTASECYRKSRTFSCLTCHDPHADPKPADDVFYTRVCANCHACKRENKSGCVGCHMKSSSPAANLRFTDHRIRVWPE